MRSLLFLASIVAPGLACSVAGCGAAPPPPPPVVAPPPPPRAVIATVEQLRGAFEQCSRRVLAPDAYLTIEPAGSAWTVRAFDVAIAIDLTAGTCDGAPVALAAFGAPGSTRIDDILANANLCAHGPPWNGRGTDSPLAWDRPRVHATATQIAVEYDEVAPASKPAGAELTVDLATGHCGIVNRE